MNDAIDRTIAMRVTSVVLLPLIGAILVLHLVLLSPSGNEMAAAVVHFVLSAFVARFLHRRACGLPAQFVTLGCSNETDETYRYFVEWAMVGMAFIMVLIAAAFPYVIQPW